MRSRAEESSPSPQEGTACAATEQPVQASAPDLQETLRSRRATRLATVPHLERLAAAAKLIGDESDEVRRALLREFRRAGRAGTPHLLRAVRSNEPHTRSQARQLLDTLAEDEVLRRLQRHVSRGKLEFESSFFLLGRLERPDLDSRPYARALDAMAQEVRRRTSHLQDDLRRGRILVKYLGEELGYRGDLDSYTQPDNVFLHRVIERRLGLPLSLCVLFTLVAKRCGLHTGIVPLPGHVMLRLYGPYQNLIVDPFHGGEPRSQEDLHEYLRDHGLEFNPVWMHDAGPRHVLRRQVANLQNSLTSIGRVGRARRLAPLLAQLTD